MKCLAKVAELTRQAQTLLPSPCSTALGGMGTSQLVISDCAPSPVLCLGFGFGGVFFRFLGFF